MIFEIVLTLVSFIAGAVASIAGSGTHLLAWIPERIFRRLVSAIILVLGVMLLL